MAERSADGPPSAEGNRFEFANVAESEPEKRDYPPDAFFENYLPLSFTQSFVLLAVAATVVDYVRVGNPDTGIPYNYPLFAGLIYIVAVLLVLRKYHGIFDETKNELVDIARRTANESSLFERDSDVTADDIEREMNEIMDWAFDFKWIFLGGLIGGVFALVVMWALDVYGSYPYVLLNYAYGAGHGFFYAPIAGSVWLIWKISGKYIVDIDILDPDGMGGYQQIGDSIVTLITYGVFLVTLDFVILSSVSFIGRPLFQWAVFAIYVLMLAFLLSITAVGVMFIRRRLLTIREKKTRVMREEFDSIEQNYWKKLQNRENPEPEAQYIQTLDTMFDQLHSMELWPINLASFGRLAFSLASSGVVAAYKAGYIPLPPLPSVPPLPF